MTVGGARVKSSKTSRSRSRRGSGCSCASRRSGGKRTRSRVLKPTRIKTARAASKSHSKPRPKAVSATRRVSAPMSITDLQFIAKSRGIPFGGLSRNKLARKINNYY